MDSQYVFVSEPAPRVLSSHSLFQDLYVSTTWLHLLFKIQPVGLLPPTRSLLTSRSDRYHQLVEDSAISSANDSYYSSGGCRDQVRISFGFYVIDRKLLLAQIIACNQNLDDSICRKAQATCNVQVLFPLGGNYDVYYVPVEDPGSYPPDFTNYINSDAVRSAIGAETTWSEENSQIYRNFVFTGDFMKSSAPHLEKVINAGIRTSIFAGDAVSARFMKFIRCSQF
jgi:hypothetical protein